MKFERGRKKNQLIWSFILKVIASQRLVKVLFLNKTRKENDSGENTLSKQRRRTRDFALSLNQRGRARESPTVGPGGPLVRFDHSSLSLLFSAERERDSGDRRRQTAAPRGHLRAGMDPPDRGGPLGGCWVDGGGRSRRRRAPRRRGLRVRSGFWAPVVSDRG